MDAPDNRTVVLLKSKATKNRFYALVPPELGWHNAEEIDDFPEDMTLGIAYPCLEDGLNDFAIIRTTFETLECFSDDAELQAEMMGMILTARESLVLRLTELRDRIGLRQAFFLGTDMEEFKRYSLQLCEKGTDRRTLDNMMKVNVFQSVAQADPGVDQYIYHYSVLPQHSLDQTRDLDARSFVVMLFDDVLAAVRDDGNYWDRKGFDRDVFQKFIALMFVNYATTDPVFYGTNKEDYGVAADKDMSSTPLYRAVSIALRKLEREEPPILTSEDSSIVHSANLGFASGGNAPANEHLIVGPLMSIAETLRLLAASDTQRAMDCRKIITRGLQDVFTQLQAMGVVSPVAAHPAEEILHQFGVQGA
ncbi:MAG TPA: hypothetical protein VGM37_19355 [Armatimonadota bacterium]|jgi:hypothetical protein